MQKPVKTEAGFVRYAEWTPRQLRFVINQLAKWTAQSRIYQMLTSPDAEELYGIETWEGSINSFWKRVKKIEPYEIEMARTEYLADFTDIPLAHKKERVLELIKLLHSIPEYITVLTKHKKEVEIFNQRGIGEKRKLLAEIRAEMGEEAWQAALEKSGTDKFAGLLDANIIEALRGNGHPED